MSTIKSSTTSTTAYSVTADTTGALVIQTGATPTTALTISSAQVVSLAQVLPEASGGTGTTTGYYGFKNRIINGAMVIDQRNAGAAITGISSSEQYPVDRLGVSSSSGGVLSAQQSSSAPTGFVNSVVVTVTTAATIFGTSGLNEVFYRIEGYNTADLQWGSASAQTITLSFWVRSSVTGTYSLGIQNNGAGRAYVATYTINTANTWEQKTITVAGDTSGTWLTTNGIGITVRWCLATGTNRIAGSANTWSSGNFIAISSTANPIMGTNGATFNITGVQLEKGSTATSFDYRPIGTELALCQRYYYQHAKNASAYVAVGWSYNSASIYAIVYFPVTMRSTPTGLFSNSVGAYTLYSNNAANTFDTFQAGNGTETSMTLYTLVLSGLTSGTAGGLYAPSGLIAFSAEL